MLRIFVHKLECFKTNLINKKELPGDGWRRVSLDQWVELQPAGSLQGKGGVIASLLTQPETGIFSLQALTTSLLCLPISMA